VQVLVVFAFCKGVCNRSNANCQFFGHGFDICAFGFGLGLISLELWVNEY